MMSRRKKNIVKFLVITFLICNILPVFISKSGNFNSVGNLKNSSLYAESVDVKITNSEKDEIINDQLFRVMLVIVSIWFGVSIVLFKLYVKVNRIEKELDID